MAKEGIPYVLVFLGMAVLLSFFSLLSSFIFLCLGVFVAFFFRDPPVLEKPCSGVVLSPAYGKVVKVEEEEESFFLKEKRTRIGIFLSVFDVHVNYAPVQGVVAHLQHDKGKFLNALKAKAAEANECNWVGVQGREGTVLVKQIAGLIARRIVCPLKRGDQLQAGQKIGLIQFGSRVDVWLPSGYKALVRKGDRVRGGITVIGERS